MSRIARIRLTLTAAALVLCAIGAYLVFTTPRAHQSVTAPAVVRSATYMSPYQAETTIYRLGKTFIKHPQNARDEQRNAKIGAEMTAASVYDPAVMGFYRNGAKNSASDRAYYQGLLKLRHQLDAQR